MLIIVCAMFSCQSQSGRNSIAAKKLLSEISCDADSSLHTLLLCGKNKDVWKIEVVKTRYVNYYELMSKYKDSAVKPVFAGSLYRPGDTCLVYCYDDYSLEKLSELFNIGELSKTKPKSTDADECSIVSSFWQYIVSEDGELTLVPQEATGQLRIYANDNYVLSLFGDKTYEFSFATINENISGIWEQSGDTVLLIPKYHCKYLSFRDDYIVKPIEDFPIYLANLFPEKVLAEGNRLILHYDCEDPLSTDDEFLDLGLVSDTLKLVYKGTRSLTDPSSM